MSKNTKVIRHAVFFPAKPVQVYDAYINEQKHSDATGGTATCYRKGRKNYSMGWLHLWKEFGIDKRKENGVRMDNNSMAERLPTINLGNIIDFKRRGY